MNLWIKTGTITLLCLSTHLCSQERDFKQKKTTEIFAEAQCKKEIFTEHYITRFLGLETRENLKAFHLGLRFFHPNHKISTKQDLLNEIHNHSSFVGTLSKEPDTQSALELLGEKNLSFLICEVQEHGKKHFYLAHSEGVRHFTLNGGIVNEKEWGWLDNGGGDYYPNLERLIFCTFS